MIRNPVGVADQEIARILAVVTLVMVAGALFLIAGVAVVFPTHLPRLGAQAAAVLGIGLAVRWRLRAGRPRGAALVGLAGLWVFLVVVSFTAGGVRGPVAPGFLLAIVVATLVLGEGIGVLVTLASAVALGGMAVLDELGRLPVPTVHHSPLTHLGVSLVLLLGAAVAQIAFSRAVAGASARAAREAEDRHRTEVELRQAQRSEAISTLARGVAHDFNNLLAAIMGNAQALLEELPPGEARQAAEDVLQASRRGRDVVRQLLAFSRSREGEVAPVSLAEMVAEVLSLLRASTPVPIRLKSAPGPVPKVLADPTLVHQALLNVATNAVQAIGGRPGAVTIRLAVREAPAAEMPGAGLPAGRYVCASVEDDGPGMSAEVAAQVFDPFFTTKAPGQGTGLGLSVVHGIMKRMGGAVTVRSSPGRGSVFTLWFPEVPEATGSAQAPPAPTPAPMEWPRAGLAAGLRALVVDDQTSVASSTARLLERSGAVVTVMGGPGAAEAAALLPPDQVEVAVLDFAMPGLDGLSLLDRLRERAPGLPAVLVSGDTAAAAPTRLARAEPVVVLAKPFSAEQLEGAIGRALAADAEAAARPPARRG